MTILFCSVLLWAIIDPMTNKLYARLFEPSVIIRSPVLRRRSIALSIVSMASLCVIATGNFLAVNPHHPLSLKITWTMALLIAGAHVLSRTKYTEIAGWIFIAGLGGGLYLRPFIMPNFSHILLINSLLYATLLMPLAGLLYSPTKARIIMILVLVATIVIPYAFERVPEGALTVLSVNVKIFAFGLLVFSMVQSWIYREGINEESGFSAKNTVHEIGRSIVQRLSQPLNTSNDLLSQLSIVGSESQASNVTSNEILAQIESHARLAMIFSKGLQFLNDIDVLLDEHVAIREIINGAEKATRGLVPSFGEMHELQANGNLGFVRTNLELAISALAILMVKFAKSNEDVANSPQFSVSCSRTMDEIMISIMASSSDLNSTAPMAAQVQNRCNDIASEPNTDFEFLIAERLGLMSGGLLHVSKNLNAHCYSISWQASKNSFAASEDVHGS